MDPSALERQAEQATAEELQRQLASAALPYLRGALRNPALETLHLVTLLRNPAASADLIEAIAAHRPWRRNHAVAAAAVKHRNVPLHLAFALVHGVGWSELAELTTTPSVHPRIKRAAENQLERRLPGLALGERVNLARRVGRGALRLLIPEIAPRVVASLLDNPRMTEVDVLRMITRKGVPGSVLQTIAGHGRWRVRRPVRMALVRHPSTPLGVAMAQLTAMTPQELVRIGRDPALRRPLRAAAQRVLREAQRNRQGFPSAH